MVSPTVERLPTSPVTTPTALPKSIDVIIDTKYDPDIVLKGIDNSKPNVNVRHVAQNNANYEPNSVSTRMSKFRQLSSRWCHRMQDALEAQ